MKPTPRCARSWRTPFGVAGVVAGSASVWSRAGRTRPELKQPNTTPAARRSCPRLFAASHGEVDAAVIDAAQVSAARGTAAPCNVAGQSDDVTAPYCQRGFHGGSAPSPGKQRRCAILPIRYLHHVRCPVRVLLVPFRYAADLAHPFDLLPQTERSAAPPNHPRSVCSTPPHANQVCSLSGTATLPPTFAHPASPRRRIVSWNDGQRVVLIGLHHHAVN